METGLYRAKHGLLRSYQRVIDRRIRRFCLPFGTNPSKIRFKAVKRGKRYLRTTQGVKDAVKAVYALRRGIVGTR